MNWEIYLALSTMLAMEYAVRGSWGPVLSSRLLGPLRMTGKQAAWIYAVYPLTCIVTPLIAGQVVDRWIASERFLAGAHLVSGLALLVAARATTFRWLLAMIGIHCLFFSPTMGVIKSVTFAHLSNPKVEYFWVRVWGSIGWVAVGWALSFWRRSGKYAFQGSDALLLAAMLSLAMALFCALFVPHTPPSGGADWASAWNPLVKLVCDRNVLILLGISLVATTQLQFYYMGTAPFLEAIGCRHANIPAIMTVAQVAEIVAIAQVLPFVLSKLGYRWTLALGPLMWAAMYAAYMIQRPRWLVIASMALHGLAFASFFDAAIVYMAQVSPPAIRGTAQSLHVAVTLGLGLFLGTRFTGIVLDRCRNESGRRWRAVFAAPCITLGLCAVGFLLLFVEP